MYSNKPEDNVKFGLAFGMDVMHLPCGGIAYYEEESTCHSYRCTHCDAVVGSVGQPQRCKEEADKYEMLAAMGGQGWDYFAEPEEVEE